jgi:hypothetical protein
MAEDKEQTDLFNNVEIEHRDDDDNDDLFSSAVESVKFPLLVKCSMAISLSTAFGSFQKLRICDMTFWNMTDWFGHRKL